MKLEVSTETKLIFHENECSNQEIFLNVSKISNSLPEKGESNCVLIYLDRTPEIIYALLAVLKKGLTYVPVNINTPKERLDYIIKNSGCQTVLTTTRYKGRFEGIKVICIDDIEPIDEKISNQNTDVDSQDIAYIIYTSGTTGHPKGISISYRAIENFIKVFNKRIGSIEQDKIIFLTDISFDISFVETIYAAAQGMTIVIADEEECKNPKSMMKLIKNNNITTLQLTPSRLKLIEEVDEEFECFCEIKRLLIGGEVFPVETLKKLNRYTKCKIYNLYGPTEATIWATVAELTDEEEVNIGEPLENMHVYIVDKNNNPVQDGEKGEILITGTGLALGYVNNSKLTDRSFIYPSFLNGEKAYLTGDLGYYNKNGQIVFLGRYDNQIKINGYRIELEEIESVLNSYYKIRNSIAGVENNKLVAIYAEKEEVCSAELREFMKSKLPDYMIPSEIRKTDNFLYTDSMKIDRNAMLARKNYKKGENLEALDKTEKRVLDVIDKNVERDRVIHLESSFEELGLDSLEFVKIIVSIEEEFGFEMEDEKLTTSAFPTINSLIQYIKRRCDNNMSI